MAKRQGLDPQGRREILLRIDATLLERVEAAARQREFARNALINRAIVHYLDHLNGLDRRADERRALSGLGDHGPDE